ncbi:class I SAM-dependent methyltransferase [Panacagrimonas sp.]|uniref:class I SAM-dependent methyltransferase n=1 Tax=Panacagrimonas sp. TaxID=2480088 RepID=UPI003B5261DE
MANYEFTVDWFTNKAGAWARLLDPNPPGNVLEIGSWEGRSSCYIVDRFAAKHPLQLFCVDTWGGGIEHGRWTMSEVESRFDRNLAIAVEQAPHPVRLRKIRCHSAAALAQLIVEFAEPPFDLIYVDGSHQAPDVLTDAVLAFRLLRVGGVMIFDDYQWRMKPPLGDNPLTRPRPAIDAFARLFADKLRRLECHPQQYAVRKTEA